MACNFGCFIEIGRLFKITRSHINLHCNNILEAVETSLLQITNRKCCVAYQIVVILMTLSDLEGHAPIAGLLKCDFVVQLRKS